MNQATSTPTAELDSARVLFVVAPENRSTSKLLLVANQTHRATEVVELSDSQMPTSVSKDVLLEMSRKKNSCYLRLGDILPKHHFLKQLQREKSRSDRSKAALSIVLFNFDGTYNKNGALGSAADLLLRNGKRDVDILGYLGDDLYALILPDTNEQGAQAFVQKLAQRAEKLPVTIITRTYPDQLFDNLFTENHDLADFYPLFLDSSVERNELGYALKRSLDFVGAVVAMVLLSPLMLITAIAIKLMSPGPIIFKQIRLGKGGVPFVFYKFRSMYVNQDDRIHREYVTSLINGNLEGINQGDTAKPLYKMKFDPRITPIGRIIRKTSIDELPQLFNVLKGEMSLVGPRPPLPYEVEKYQAWHLGRILEIKPGLTGLWQVEGRSKTSFDDMVRMDIRYMRSCSLWLDLKIVFKTVKVVLQCNGAN